MACSDEVVIQMEKMRKALVVVVEELEIQNKGSGSREAMAVDKRSVEALVEALIALVEAEKTRKALLEVVEALEVKTKGSGSREALVKTGKEKQTKRSVDALVQALVALVEAEKQAERSVVDRILDEYQFVDLFEEGTDDEVDEEDLKKAAELHGYISGMWKEWADRARAAGIQFGKPNDPSDPQCLVAC